jgi:hypothetical protein
VGEAVILGILESDEPQGDLLRRGGVVAVAKRDGDRWTLVADAFPPAVVAALRGLAR